MNRLFLGNFDFEHSLAANSAHSRNPSAGIKRLQQELASLWPSIADDGDWVWLPTPVEAGFFDGLIDAGLPHVKPIFNLVEIDTPVEACPWGWTDVMRIQCEREGWRFAAPPQEIIRQVNSRRFSL